MDGRIFLKVKIKSLQAEARIIRKEELRCRLRNWSDVRASLYSHRVLIVRKAARHALLAYGFLRGRVRARVEPGGLLSGLQEVQEALTGRVHRRRSEPDWKEVQRLVARYGNRPDTEALAKELAAWAKS